MEESGKHLQGGIQLTENDLRNHVSDLFSPISVEQSITGGRLNPMPPSSSSGGKFYEFEIEARGQQYIIPKLCRMDYSYRIVQANGTAITDAHDVAPVNLIGTSMWQTIEIYTNGSEAVDCKNELANYKAYQEITHTYGQDARTTHLAGYGAVWDTANKFDDFGTGAIPAAGNVAAVAERNSENTAHMTRKEFTKLSTYHHLYHPIHNDFFQLSKAIPPLEKLKVRFTKAKDEFLLNTRHVAPVFKIEIKDFKLWIRFVDMHHDIVAEHKTLFARNIPCRYAGKKTEIKTFSFPANSKSLNINKMFSGEVLPKTLFIGIVKADALLGNFQLNPFNFDNCGMKSVVIKVNGVAYPNEPYQPNFAEGNYMRMYRDFFDNTGVHSNDYGTIMTQKLFKNGMCTPAFDLTPDMCNGSHFHSAQSGVISGHIELAANLAHGIEVMVFAYYDVIVTIDKYSRINVIKNPVGIV